MTAWQEKDKSEAGISQEGPRKNVSVVILEMVSEWPFIKGQMFDY